MAQKSQSLADAFTPRLVENRYALQPGPRSGGMATVYRASDLCAGGRLVALKLFDHKRVEQRILDEAYRRERQALKELRHPNIAELVDDGIDGETGNYFLVLEWVENDLNSRAGNTRYLDWGAFAKDVGFGLLEALGFAHGRDIAHRDVKPSNILVSDDGVVKLSDFGVSKIKRWLQSKVTLNEYVSRPFAPPEYDDGSYTYTRDVFGFAMVATSLLSGHQVADYDDIPKAINSLRAPPEVADVFRRALSLQPEKRQANAVVLLAELRSIEQARARITPVRKTCYLQLASRAIEQLQVDLGLSSEREIADYVLEDLNSGCAAENFIFDRGQPTERSESGHFHILGSALRYHVMVAKPHRSYLVIAKAFRSEFAQLERWKGNLYRPPFVFGMGRPPTPAEGQSVLCELEQSIEEHTAERRLSAAKAQDEHLFRTWMDILSAKEQVEEDRESPLAYRAVRVDGQHAQFTLVTDPDPEHDLMGQLRRVQLTESGYLSGEVEDVSGNKLTLYINYGDRDRLPQNGNLAFDVSAAKIALDRQRNALEAVRFDQAIRSRIRELLLHPEQARIPVPVVDVEFITADLDDAKKNAVRAALGADDFLIVEGPPGTGKTTFIAELILQFLRRRPEARILLTSQTHVALDNAIARVLKADPNLSIVRIARSDDRRVAAEVKPCTIDEQMRRWSEEIVVKSEAFLTQWAEERGIDHTRIRTAIVLQRLAAEKEEVETVRRELSVLHASPHTPSDPSGGQAVSFGGERDALQRDTDLLRERLEAAKKKQQLLEGQLRAEGTLSLDINKLGVSDLRGLADQMLPQGEEGLHFCKLVQIQAEWSEQCGRGSDFNSALLQRSQVVAGTCIGMLSVKEVADLDYDLCILDEASKATATEALVPMSRARRWVLVGDPRQLPPFEDEIMHRDDLLTRFALDRADVKETLFGRMMTYLPQECQTMLSIQHRMVEPIGNLISQCFYDGKLKSARTVPDAVVIEIMKRPVVWLTTAKVASHHEEKRGKSYMNLAESQAIVDFILDLDDLASLRQRPFTLAVLTGYMAQLECLERVVQTHRPRLRSVQVSCSTVDAVQGREADFVIYSVTRSNPTGSIGFLKEFERINVALSRGRDGLLIVGDHRFVSSIKAEHPLKKVLAYIRTHPVECDIQEVTL